MQVNYCAFLYLRWYEIFVMRFTIPSVPHANELDRQDSKRHVPNHEFYISW